MKPLTAVYTHADDFALPCEAEAAVSSQRPSLEPQEPQRIPSLGVLNARPLGWIPLPSAARLAAAEAEVEKSLERSLPNAPPVGGGDASGGIGEALSASEEPSGLAGVVSRLWKSLKRGVRGEELAALEAFAKSSLKGCRGFDVQLGERQSLPELGVTRWSSKNPLLIEAGPQKVAATTWVGHTAFVWIFHLEESEAFLQRQTLSDDEALSGFAPSLRGKGASLFTFRADSPLRFCCFLPQWNLLALTEDSSPPATKLLRVAEPTCARNAASPSQQEEMGELRVLQRLVLPREDLLLQSVRSCASGVFFLCVSSAAGEVAALVLRKEVLTGGAMDEEAAALSEFATRDEGPAEVRLSTGDFVSAFLPALSSPPSYVACHPSLPSAAVLGGGGEEGGGLWTAHLMINAFRREGEGAELSESEEEKEERMLEDRRDGERQHRPSASRGRGRRVRVLSDPFSPVCGMLPSIEVLRDVAARAALCAAREYRSEDASAASGEGRGSRASTRWRVLESPASFYSPVFLDASELRAAARRIEDRALGRAASAKGRVATAEKAESDCAFTGTETEKKEAGDAASAEAEAFLREERLLFLASERRAAAARKASGRRPCSSTEEDKPEAALRVFPKVRHAAFSACGSFLAVTLTSEEVLLLQLQQPSKPLRTVGGDDSVEALDSSLVFAVFCFLPLPFVKELFRQATSQAARAGSQEARPSQSEEKELKECLDELVAMEYGMTDSAAESEDCKDSGEFSHDASSPSSPSCTLRACTFAGEEGSLLVLSFEGSAGESPRCVCWDLQRHSALLDLAAAASQRVRLASAACVSSLDSARNAEAGRTLSAALFTVQQLSGGGLSEEEVQTESLCCDQALALTVECREKAEGLSLWMLRAGDVFSVSEALADSFGAPAAEACLVKVLKVLKNKDGVGSSPGASEEAEDVTRALDELRKGGWERMLRRDFAEEGGAANKHGDDDADFKTVLRVEDGEWLAEKALLFNPFAFSEGSDGASLREETSEAAKAAAAVGVWIPRTETLERLHLLLERALHFQLDAKRRVVEKLKEGAATEQRPNTTAGAAALFHFPRFFALRVRLSRCRAVKRLATAANQTEETPAESASQFGCDAPSGEAKEVAECPSPLRERKQPPSSLRQTGAAEQSAFCAEIEGLLLSHLLRSLWLWISAPPTEEEAAAVAAQLAAELRGEEVEALVGEEVFAADLGCVFASCLQRRAVQKLTRLFPSLLREPSHFTRLLEAVPSSAPALVALSLVREALVVSEGENADCVFGRLFLLALKVVCSAGLLQHSALPLLDGALRFHSQIKRRRAEQPWEETLAWGVAEKALLESKRVAERAAFEDLQFSRLPSEERRRRLLRRKAEDASKAARAAGESLAAAVLAAGTKRSRLSSPAPFEAKAGASVRGSAGSWIPRQDVASLRESFESEQGEEGECESAGGEEVQDVFELRLRVLRALLRQFSEVQAVRRRGPWGERAAAPFSLAASFSAEEAGDLRAPRQRPLKKTARHAELLLSCAAESARAFLLLRPSLRALLALVSVARLGGEEAAQEALLTKLLCLPFRDFSLSEEHAARAQQLLESASLLPPFSSSPTSSSVVALVEAVDLQALTSLSAQLDACCLKEVFKADALEAAAQTGGLLVGVGENFSSDYRSLEDLRWDLLLAVAKWTSAGKSPFVGKPSFSVSRALLLTLRRTSAALPVARLRQLTFVLNRDEDAPRDADRAVLEAFILCADSLQRLLGTSSSSTFRLPTFEALDCARRSEESRLRIFIPLFKRVLAIHWQRIERTFRGSGVEREAQWKQVLRAVVQMHSRCTGLPPSEGWASLLPLACDLPASPPCTASDANSQRGQTQRAGTSTEQHVAQFVVAEWREAARIFGEENDGDFALRAARILLSAVRASLDSASSLGDASVQLATRLCEEALALLQEAERAVVASLDAQTKRWEAARGLALRQGGGKEEESEADKSRVFGVAERSRRLRELRLLKRLCGEERRLAAVCVALNGLLALGSVPSVAAPWFFAASARAAANATTAVAAAVERVLLGSATPQQFNREHETSALREFGDAAEGLPPGLLLGEGEAFAGFGCVAFPARPFDLRDKLRSPAGSVSMLCVLAASCPWLAQSHPQTEAGLQTLAQSLLLEQPHQPQLQRAAVALVRGWAFLSLGKNREAFASAVGLLRLEVPSPQKRAAATDVSEWISRQRNSAAALAVAAASCVENCETAPSLRSLAVCVAGAESAGEEVFSRAVALAADARQKKSGCGGIAGGFFKEFSSAAATQSDEGEDNDAVFPRLPGEWLCPKGSAESSLFFFHKPPTRPSLSRSSNRLRAAREGLCLLTNGLSNGAGVSQEAPGENGLCSAPAVSDASAETPGTRPPFLLETSTTAPLQGRRDTWAGFAQQQLRSVSSSLCKCEGESLKVFEKEQQQTPPARSLHPRTFLSRLAAVDPGLAVSFACAVGSCSSRERNGGGEAQDEFHEDERECQELRETGPDPRVLFRVFRWLLQIPNFDSDGVARILELQLLALRRFICKKNSAEKRGSRRRLRWSHASRHQRDQMLRGAAALSFLLQFFRAEAKESNSAAARSSQSVGRGEAVANVASLLRVDVASESLSSLSQKLAAQSKLRCGRIGGGEETPEPTQGRHALEEQRIPDRESVCEEGKGAWEEDDSFCWAFEPRGEEGVAGAAAASLSSKGKEREGLFSETSFQSPPLSQRLLSRPPGESSAERISLGTSGVSQLLQHSEGATRAQSSGREGDDCASLHSRDATQEFDFGDAWADDDLHLEENAFVAVAEKAGLADGPAGSGGDEGIDTLDPSSNPIPDLGHQSEQPLSLQQEHTGGPVQEERKDVENLKLEERTEKDGNVSSESCSAWDEDSLDLSPETSAAASQLETSTPLAGSEHPALLEQPSRGTDAAAVEEVPVSEEGANCHSLNSLQNAHPPSLEAPSDRPGVAASKQVSEQGVSGEEMTQQSSVISETDEVCTSSGKLQAEEIEFSKCTAETADLFFAGENTEAMLSQLFNLLGLASKQEPPDMGSPVPRYQIDNTLLAARKLAADQNVGSSLGNIQRILFGSEETCLTSVAQEVVASLMALMVVAPRLLGAQMLTTIFLLTKIRHGEAQLLVDVSAHTTESLTEQSAGECRRCAEILSELEAALGQARAAPIAKVLLSNTSHELQRRLLLARQVYAVCVGGKERLVLSQIASLMVAVSDGPQAGDNSTRACLCDSSATRTVALKSGLGDLRVEAALQQLFGLVPETCVSALLVSHPNTVSSSAPGPHPFAQALCTHVKQETFGLVLTLLRKAPPLSDACPSEVLCEALLRRHLASLDSGAFALIEEDALSPKEESSFHVSGLGQLRSSPPSSPRTTSSSFGPRHPRVGVIDVLLRQISVTQWLPLLHRLQQQHVPEQLTTAAVVLVLQSMKRFLDLENVDSSHSVVNTISTYQEILRFAAAWEECVGGGVDQPFVLTRPLSEASAQVLLETHDEAYQRFCGAFWRLLARQSLLPVQLIDETTQLQSLFLVAQTVCEGICDWLEQPRTAEMSASQVGRSFQRMLSRIVSAPLSSLCDRLVFGFLVHKTLLDTLRKRRNQSQRHCTWRLLVEVWIYGSMLRNGKILQESADALPVESLEGIESCISDWKMKIRCVHREVNRQIQYLIVTLIFCDDGGGLDDLTSVVEQQRKMDASLVGQIEDECLDDHFTNMVIESHLSWWEREDSRSHRAKYAMLFFCGDMIARRVAVSHGNNDSVKYFATPLKLWQLILSRATSVEEHLALRLLAGWQGIFKEKWLGQIATRSPLLLLISDCTSDREDAINTLTSAVKDGSIHDDFDDMTKSFLCALTSKETFVTFNVVKAGHIFLYSSMLLLTGNAGFLITHGGQDFVRELCNDRLWDTSEVFRWSDNDSKQSEATVHLMEKVAEFLYSWWTAFSPTRDVNKEVLPSILTPAEIYTLSCVNYMLCFLKKQRHLIRDGLVLKQEQLESSLYQSLFSRSGGKVHGNETTSATGEIQRIFAYDRTTERQELQLFVGLACSISHTHELIADQLALFITCCLREE